MSLRRPLAVGIGSITISNVCYFGAGGRIGANSDIEIALFVFESGYFRGWAKNRVKCVVLFGGFARDGENKKHSISLLDGRGFAGHPLLGGGG